MVLGVGAALVAGLLFAIGGVLQQRAAATRPTEESLSFRLLWHLAQDRLWLAGIGVAIVSFVVQAVALASAPLAVVQPLIVSELIFAIPISVRLRRSRLHRREWAGIAAVSVGLAGSIIAAHPRPGNPLVPATSWAPLLGVVVLIGGAALWAGTKVIGPARASAFALAAAMVMAVESALMAATTHLFERGITAALSTWEPYAMAVASVTELLLVQSAFQAGPLAASMPVTDAVQPLMAVGIGLALFGEQVQTSAVRLAVSAAGLLALLAGILSLDTSPVVRAIYREESRERDDRQRRPAAASVS